MRWGTRTVAAALAVAAALLAAVTPSTPAYVGPLAGAASPLDGPPLCGTEPGAGAEAPDDGVVRVATFNVLHSLDDDADATMDVRIELLADALAGSGADAMGLQEVVASANHGLVVSRLATALADRTGDDWHWCFNRSNPHVPGEADAAPGGAGGPLSALAATQARSGDATWTEGVAVVARFPITASEAHRLTPRSAEAPFCVAEDPGDPFSGPTCALDTRQILWALVATPCGDLDLFTSHLAHHLSSQTGTVQELQIADGLATIDRLATPGPLPDVYVGDFNTVEGSPVHRAATDAGFVDTFRADQPTAAGWTSGQDITAPVATVTQRIDYVFARPGTSALAPSAAEVIGDQPAPLPGAEPGAVVWPSDHYGVAVSLGCGSITGGASA
jgi:endonuclease/exonuclease/phosphatase family metal-dependent hydrolase